MRDERKTKAQLINDLAELRQLVAKLEAAEAQRVQTEEALRESEENYRALFETMAQGVVYQAADGRISAANPAATRILGLTLDQMQGRTSMDPRWRAIHEDGSDFPGETHPSMVALKSGKEVRNVVMGVFSPLCDEYRWININAVPEFNPGEKTPYQVYTTFDDITERVQAEEERERLIVELQEALDKIKTLRGLLPICASCKKIRDDEGYWQDVAVYIRNHSEADFTHGICPDCAKKLYPEFFADAE